MEKLQANICFDARKHRVRQQVTKKIYFKNTLNNFSLLHFQIEVIFYFTVILYLNIFVCVSNSVGLYANY